MIKRKAYAKINLALDVLGKYPNGYHEVKMVMQTIDLYDVLSFESFDCSTEIQIEDRIRLVSDNSGELSLGTDNLIYKAAAKLVDYFPAGKGVKISLEKNIPVAAGMAGGSTDGAAALHGINELFGLGLSDEQLCDIGVNLGADVPYCIMGGTMLAEGIGEKLTKLADTPELTLVVAKPEMGVSTKYVYEHLDAYDNPPHPDVDGMIQAIEQADKTGIADRLGNILETVTVPACPEVAQIKGILAEQGADGVLMSGSGPTVFSVFSDVEKAQKAVDALKNDSPAKFVCMTKTCSGKQ
ncbi:MAG: 4-(cytidine 5'-diphospho)-2-C-methyl-D-erythritol kinase [Lachnospiraceae bacterium]|nr:4-(cytidine 5'-diphospho)-2-C-methyl-D-erythritol kinase [Lachnospiraceae bacterium]